MEAHAESNTSANVSLLRTFLVIAVMLLALAIAFIVVLQRTPSGGLALPTGYQVVHVDESEYVIHMTDTSVPAGNVVFVDTNRGTIPHEFVIFKTTLPAARLPEANDKTVDEEAPALEVVADSGSALAPGETRLITANLEPGHYAVVCNLPPNHYTAGMHVDLNVGGGAVPAARPHPLRKISDSDG